MSATVELKRKLCRGKQRGMHNPGKRQTNDAKNREQKIPSSIQGLKVQRLFQVLRNLCSKINL
jgi:hypothetical protein